MWCLYIQGFCIAADPDDNLQNYSSYSEGPLYGEKM